MAEPLPVPPAEQPKQKQSRWHKLVGNLKDLGVSVGITPGYVNQMKDFGSTVVDEFITQPYKSWKRGDLEGMAKPVTDMAKGLWNQYAPPVPGASLDDIGSAWKQDNIAGATIEAIPFFGPQINGIIEAHAHGDMDTANAMATQLLAQVMAAKVAPEVKTQAIKAINAAPEVAKTIGKEIAAEGKKLATDESGFVTREFLGVADEIANKTLTKPGLDLHRAINMGKPDKVLEMARGAAKDLAKGAKRNRVGLDNATPQVRIGAYRTMTEALEKAKTDYQRRTGVSPHKNRQGFMESPEYGRFKSGSWQLPPAEPGRVVINVGPNPDPAYIDGPYQSIRADASLHAMGHEIGHAKSSYSTASAKTGKPQLIDSAADQVVNEYINDHFINNKSRLMQKIGRGLKRDIDDPKFQATPAEEAMYINDYPGRIRNELLADAYAWKQAKESLGFDKAMETFPPISAASYLLGSLEEGMSGRALSKALMHQDMKNLVKGAETRIGGPAVEEVAWGQNEIAAKIAANEARIKELQAALRRKPGEYGKLPSPPESKVFTEDNPSVPTLFDPAERKWVNIAKPDPEGGYIFEPGELAPEHAQKIRPDLRNVRYNPDPNAKRWAMGNDSKGRSQSKYNPEFDKAQRDLKHSRVREDLTPKINQMMRKVGKDAKIGNDTAAALRLVMDTGIRPGSKKDTLAEKQAFGATTLEGRHVIGDNPKNVTLQFVGKKGKDLNIKVTNKDVARDLLERRDRVGPDGKLFNTSARKVLDYSKGFGEFMTKDHRTYNGTQAAIAQMKKIKAPTTKKEFKEAVRQVAIAASNKLGNTPAIALQRYIDPTIFAEWRKLAGMEDEVIK